MLLFINWYVAENRSIVVTPEQQTYFIDVLLEFVRRDEANCGTFINRAYYLLRKYLLVFRKASYSSEKLIKLLRTSSSEPKGSE